MGVRMNKTAMAIVGAAFLIYAGWSISQIVVLHKVQSECEKATLDSISPGGSAKHADQACKLALKVANGMFPDQKN
jgi:hypothetical protein